MKVMLVAPPGFNSTLIGRIQRIQKTIVRKKTHASVAITSFIASSMEVFSPGLATSLALHGFRYGEKRNVREAIACRMEAIAKPEATGSPNDRGHPGRLKNIAI